jgi:hypothetical protein
VLDIKEMNRQKHDHRPGNLENASFEAGVGEVNSSRRRKEQIGEEGKVWKGFQPDIPLLGMKLEWKEEGSCHVIIKPKEAKRIMFTVTRCTFTFEQRTTSRL